VVMDALRTINREDGITVICNLHTLDTARNYCDRIIGLAEGKVVFDGNPGQLTQRMAREIYGAEAEEAFQEGMTSTALGGEPAKPRLSEADLKNTQADARAMAG
jgi:phosphonate transport system ATP-binding protein